MSDKQSFWQHLDRSTWEVSQWPAWKRGENGRKFEDKIYWKRGQRWLRTWDATTGEIISDCRMADLAPDLEKKWIEKLRHDLRGLTKGAEL
jgi:hypothetical protein